MYFTLYITIKVRGLYGSGFFKGYIYLLKEKTLYKDIGNCSNFKARIFRFFLYLMYVYDEKYQLPKFRMI